MSVSVCCLLCFSLGVVGPAHHVEAGVGPSDPPRLSRRTSGGGGGGDHETGDAAGFGEGWRAEG